ncbi:phosphate ABC transporter substrate-binding protein [Sulfurifustis variabilis]|uniref:Phosphate ABC transporter substrate-binding protein n=1 Tax=Sulfurifustis variabilis TaxID=1675686 RepID=A0A1B4V6S6_9GAMM|nr:PhnD/SsuA/transferrin family substrate-binding protein [Sulfurifustis variabilis]BAU49220.1 phosphate ABC transporter substrate-binding protein [Sulfurifustis variabilis]
MFALTRFQSLCIAALALALAVPARAADYVFSAPPLADPIDDRAVYGPVAEYLSAVIGKKIVYRRSDNSLAYPEQMRKGTYDLAFDDPHFVSWRMVKLQHTPLAKLPGELVFAVVSRNDNNEVSDVRDLIGRPVCALVPPNIATLTLMAQFENPAREPLIVEKQSYTATYEGVISKSCVGAAVPVGIAQKLANEGVMRIIYESDGVPNQGFSAGPRFSAEDRTKMADALVAPEARTKLARFFDTWSKDKNLQRASHAEYQGVARLLKNTYGFDLSATAADPTVR